MTRHPISLGILVALLLSGCAVVRDARLAQNPASAVLGERTATAAELGLPDEGVIALDDLVNAALRAHPSVVLAQFAADAAQARCRTAEAASLPTMTVGASAGAQDATTPSEPAPPVENRFRSFGFDVSWLLFDFGRTSALECSAAEQWLAAQEDLREAQTDVVFGVRSGYAELARWLRLLEIAEETTRQFEIRLEQVREFARAGTRIPYDVTKAELDLGNARLAVVKARDEVLKVRANLANAVGLAEVVGWIPAPSADAVEPPRAFDLGWDEALRNRPSVAAARARERAASALVDAAVAELYPRLDVGFGYSASASPVAWAWQAAPALRWVPFDGFANLASIEEQVAVLRGSRASLAQLEQQAWLDVRNAWIAVEDARQRLALASDTIRTAEENLNLAQGRFRVGTGTSVELTDAHLSVAQARGEAVEAQADHEGAVARLRRAIGEAREGADQDGSGRR